MTSFFARRAFLLAPLGVLLVAALYGACTPGSEITAAESDVVVTLYDKDFNFGSVKKYMMPDTIFHITGDSTKADSDLISRDNDALILSTIEDRFTDRNYVRTMDPDSADFNVVVAAQAVQTWSVYSWYPWNPWYGWYPWYWWYYPPSVGVSYAFTLGTLYIQMGDFEENPGISDPDKKTAYWYVALNGVLDDSSGRLTSRVTGGIKQAFDQSPYLRTD